MDFMNFSDTTFQKCECMNETDTLCSLLCGLYVNENSTNILHLDTENLDTDMTIFYTGLDIYAFLTPVIIIIGLIGNAISLRVFLSRRMRKMSASLYLAALAISDTAALFMFVFVEWLRIGLQRWPGAPPDGFNIQGHIGLCQVFLYFAYVFRFLSAWIIVIFTGERYIGVCKPLQRRAMCTNSFTKRALAGVIMVAMAVCAFKPLISTVREAKTVNGTNYLCTHKSDLQYANFILDGLYAGVITALPFLIITCLNVLIVRRLRLTRQRHLRINFASEESTIRLEFTAILLVVSSTFVILNLPYFVLWCYNFKLRLDTSYHHNNPTQGEGIRGGLYIAKTVFFGNYCVNFFIYSLTGGYFRKQLKSFCDGTQANCSNSRCKTTNGTHLVAVPTNGSMPSQWPYKDSVVLPMIEVNHQTLNNN